MTQYSLVNQFPISIPTWMATVANQLQTDGDWVVYAWSDGSTRHVFSGSTLIVGDLSAIHSYVELSHHGDGTGKGVAWINNTGGTTSTWIFYNTVDGWSTATGGNIGTPTALDLPTDKRCFSTTDPNSSVDTTIPPVFPQDNSSCCHLVYNTDGYFVSFGWSNSFLAQFIFGVFPLIDTMVGDVDPYVYLAQGTGTLRGVADWEILSNTGSYAPYDASCWFGRTLTLAGIYRSATYSRYACNGVNTPSDGVYNGQDALGHFHAMQVRIGRNDPYYDIKQHKGTLYWTPFNTIECATGTPFYVIGTANKSHVAFNALCLPWTGDTTYPISSP